MKQARKARDVARAKAIAENHVDKYCFRSRLSSAAGRCDCCKLPTPPKGYDEEVWDEMARAQRRRELARR